MVKVYWNKVDGGKWVYLYFNIPLKNVSISSLRVLNKKNLGYGNKKGSERGWLIKNFYQSGGIKVIGTTNKTPEYYVTKSFIKVELNDIIEKWGKDEIFDSFNTFFNPKEILIRELKNEGTRKS